MCHFGKDGCVADADHQPPAVAAPDREAPGLSFDAIVLAGGAGRRLGGVDKAELIVSGRTLLERAVDAVSFASRRILVGPARTGTLPADVLITREDPPGGGPVAAIEAGLRLVRKQLVVVLACDMPFVTSEVVNDLVERLSLSPATGQSAASAEQGAAPSDADGVVLVDRSGLRQPLCAAYRSNSLRRSVARLPSVRGAAVRSLINALTVAEVPAGAMTTLDCDTWESVLYSRRQMEKQ